MLRYVRRTVFGSKIGGIVDKDDDLVTAHDSDEDDDGEEEQANEDGGSVEDVENFDTTDGRD